MDTQTLAYRIQQLNIYADLLRATTGKDVQVPKMRDWALLSEDRLAVELEKRNTEIAKELVVLLSSDEWRRGYAGEPGKDAPQMAEIKEEIIRQVDALPKPKNGKDGKDAPSMDAIKAELQKMVDAIPRPEDGLDAEIDQETIDAIVQSVYQAIEIPQPKIIKEIVEVAIPEERDFIDRPIPQAGVASLPEKLEQLEKKINNIKLQGGRFGTAINEWGKIGGDINSQTDLINLINNSAGGADWTYYATKWSSTPTLNTDITGGDVYDYTLDGTTRYRFVPSTYNPTQDAFYSSFDGTTLSDLITARG